MAKKNNTELNDIKENSKVLKNPNKNWKLMMGVFILGLILLAFLYYNFRTSYQINNVNPEVVASSPETIITSTIKKDSLADQHHSHMPASNKTETIQQSELPKQNSHNIQSSNSCNCKCPASCSSLLSFTQSYLLLKTKIESADNFSDLLIDLTHYKINSEDIRNNLDYLLRLSAKNHSKQYFVSKFNSLIKPIYKHTKQFHSFDLRDYFFIRAIGERAMTKDDLDKTIFIISQALENNDLKTVDENLNKLPQDNELINHLKQDVIDQLTIRNIIANMDSILLNDPDCNIVSQ